MRQPTRAVCGHLLILTVVVLAGACVRIGIGGDPSLERIERSVTEHLQPGASFEEINVYLDEEGKKAGLEVRAEATSTAFSFTGLGNVAPDTPVFVAAAHGQISSVTVVFVLGEDLSLRKAVFFEHFSGP